MRARNVTLALLSALLYAASFPPLALAPLAWLALVPLLIALARVGPAAGAALGLAFSFVSGALLAYWLPGMLAGFFSLGFPAALAIAAGAVLLCVLPYAGFGAVVSWASRRGAAGPGVVALAWGACELFRSAGPLETPFGFLAFSQGGWLGFVQGADLVGALGLSMLMAAVAGALAALFPASLRPGRRGLALAWPAAALAATLAYGELRLRQDFGVGDPVRVALVQGAVEPERRFAPEFRGENLARHLELTERARETAPDLVLWPEFAVEFDVATDPERWRELLALSESLEGELLFGAPYVRHRLFVREELNSAFLLRAGRVVGRHDKVRLMPFSETRPRLLPVGRDRYRAGEALQPLDARAGVLGVMLCSEGMLPGLVAGLASDGAELLVNPSNDDWFASRSAADHQLAVAVFRAVENRRPVLRPSTSGRSGVVDAHGRILAVAPYREPALIVAEVRRSRTRTPYQQLSRGLSRPASVLALVPLVTLVAVRRRDS